MSDREGPITIFMREPATLDRIRGPVELIGVRADGSRKTRTLLGKQTWRIRWDGINFRCYVYQLQEIPE